MLRYLEYLLNVLFTIPDAAIQIIAPIICDADAIGTVILFTTEFNKKITDTEYKLVESTANFLAKQLED